MSNMLLLLNEKPIPNKAHYLIACILYVFYILDLTIKWAYIWLPEAWRNGVDCVRCMIAHWRWFVWLWENLEWIILHNRVKVWKIFCCNKRWRQKRCHFSLVLWDLFLSKISSFFQCVEKCNIIGLLTNTKNMISSNDYYRLSIGLPNIFIFNWY